MSLFSYPAHKDNQKEYLTQILSLLIGVGMLASVAGIGAMLAANIKLGLYVFVGIFLGLIFSWFLILRSQYKLSVWLVCILLWLGVTTFGAYASNYLLPMITSYAVIVLAAALVLGVWQALVFAALSTGASILIPYLVATNILDIF